MKSLITFILLFAFTRAFAQQPIEVNIEQRPTSFGIQPGFEMLVPQATPNEAIDLWKKTVAPKKLLKKTPKMKKIKDEWWINNIVIDDISSMPLNVITQVASYPGHIYVRIFFQSESGFLGSPGSSEKTGQAAINYIRTYGVDLYRLAVEKELNEEERKLKVLENNLNRLQRKNNSYGDAISDVMQDKASLSMDAQYQNDLLNNDGRNQLGVIGEASKEDLSDQLKTTQKELKKAEKAEKRLNKKVNKNVKEQREIANEIEKQKEKVEEVKTKLNNIS